MTVLLRFLPPDYRPWNLVPLGAGLLFAGARLSRWPSFLIPFAALLGTDLAFYFVRDWPLTPVVYVSYALYLLLGLTLLRRTESPLIAGGVAVLGSLQFFLVTNFACWLGPNYPHDFAGLTKCYTLALPFAKGTLVGDVVFTLAFVGLYAWLTRVYFRAERVGVAAGVES